MLLLLVQAPHLLLAVAALAIYGLRLHRLFGMAAAVVGAVIFLAAILKPGPAALVAVVAAAKQLTQELVVAAHPALVAVVAVVPAAPPWEALAEVELLPYDGAQQKPMHGQSTVQTIQAQPRQVTDTNITFFMHQEISHHDHPHRNSTESK